MTATLRYPCFENIYRTNRMHEANLKQDPNKQDDLNHTRHIFACITPVPPLIFGVGLTHSRVRRLTAAPLYSISPRGGDETMTAGLDKGRNLATQSKSTSIADSMAQSTSSFYRRRQEGSSGRGKIGPAFPIISARLKLGQRLSALGVRRRSESQKV